MDNRTVTHTINRRLDRLSLLAALLVTMVMAVVLALDARGGDGAAQVCADGTCSTTLAGTDDHAQAVTRAGTPQLAAGLLSTDGFTPRWECGTFSSLHGWTHIIADILIFGAYAAIPILITFFVFRRKDVPFPRIFWLFGAFIFACGFGHLIEATLFVQPWYRLSATIKVLTAAVSWATVIALIPILPRALALPGLARVNDQLRQEVGQRIDAEHAMQQLNQELRSRNEEMERFVYTVSHDLKSPLVTIRGFVGFMEEDLRHGKGEALQDSLSRIRRGTDRMVKTIDELLELSRIGRVVHDPVPVNISELAQQIADEVSTTHDVGSARVDVQPDMPTLVIDPIRIREVFENLLNNAFKYGCSNPQPHIRIGSARHEGEIRFVVQDNGTGIDPQYQDKVFELFQRVDREHEGTGVGLAIVRRIMEVHGGRAWVESTPGQGASFWIALPDALVERTHVPQVAKAAL